MEYFEFTIRRFLLFRIVVERGRLRLRRHLPVGRHTMSSKIVLSLLEPRVMRTCRFVAPTCNTLCLDRPLLVSNCALFHFQNLG